MFPRRRKRAPSDETIASEQAVQDARKTLKRIEARQDEVREVATSLRHIRRRNHFAEQLRDMMLSYPVGKEHR